MKLNLMFKKIYTNVLLHVCCGEPPPPLIWQSKANPHTFCAEREELAPKKVAVRSQQPKARNKAGMARVRQPLA